MVPVYLSKIMYLRAGDVVQISAQNGPNTTVNNYYSYLNIKRIG